MSAQLPNFPAVSAGSGFPGPTYPNSLDGTVQLEFEHAYGQLEGWMSADHNADGTHKNIHAVTLQSENGILSGTGQLNGQMPSIFGNGSVISLIDIVGMNDNFAGFFGASSARSQAGRILSGLGGYVYLNHPTGDTIAAAAGTYSVLQHDGAGVLTFGSAVTGQLFISSTGGGTTATCYYANPAGRLTGATGTFTNGVGLYIDAFGAGFTNKYSILSTDSSAILSHAGPVSMGTFAVATDGLFSTGTGLNSPVNRTTIATSFVVVEANGVLSHYIGGFTGSGAFTNFTIDNGVITAAS